MPKIAKAQFVAHLIARRVLSLLRSKRAWAVSVVALILLLILVPRIIGVVIAHKLKHEVEMRLNATFTYGSAVYLLPYGLRIDHAALTTNLPDVGPTPVLRIDRVELHLAKLPFGAGPVMVDRVAIVRPVVRLLNLPDGMFGKKLAGGTSTATDVQTSNPPTPTASPAVAATKVSDLFRLNRLTISDGSLEYEDRIGNNPVQPVTWAAITTDIKLAPVGPGLYKFDLTADHAPLATAKVSGDIDVDTLLLHLSQLTMNVKATSNQPPAELPKPLRKLCDQFGIGGELALTGSATVPLDAPTRGYYSAQLQLKDGCCRVVGFDRPLSPVRGEFNFNNLPDPAAAIPAEAPAKAIPVQFQLNDFAIDCDKQLLRIDHAAGSMNAVSQSWTLRELSGRVDAGNGPGPVADAKVWSRLPFTAAGSGHFSAANPYWALLTITDGTAIVTDQKLPLRHINLDLYATPGKLQVQRLVADALAGKLKGNVDFKLGDTKSYTGKISIEHADARQAADLFMTDEQDRQKISGAATFRASFSGLIPPDAPRAGPGSIEDRLVATGDFDVRDGDFYQIPMLKDVCVKMNVPNAANVGEAAATFDVRRQQVTFYNVAANSDAVGVQGNGTINFDGIADMTLIATPLSDWREKMQRSHIQYLQDIGAEIAGKAQAGFNTVQRVALYQFRLTGPLATPDVKAVPLPAETKAIKSAFQKMAQLRDQYHSH